VLGLLETGRRLAEEPVMKTSNGIVWGSAINLTRNETLVWG